MFGILAALAEFKRGTLTADEIDTLLAERVEAARDLRRFPFIR